MFEYVQYLVSSKKLEDGFGMDNVAVVNGKWKITRLFRVYTFDLFRAHSKCSSCRVTHVQYYD